MTSRAIFPGSQPPSKPPNLSNPSSQIPTVDASAQELCARMNSLWSSTLTLLQDTEWPPESNEAAQNLLQTIKSFPELPEDTTFTKDSAGRFIRALEDAHTTLKTASEKYGSRERGIRDGIKYRISSLRPNKCIEILRTCREDMEKTSVALRNFLDGNTAIDSPENEENQNPIRSGVLIGARMTFKTVEAISGTIPGVGNYVGVAAKVGLAFVSMIETMDKNEDVAKELTSHVSKLSTHLEHFKKKSDVQQGDEVAKHIDDVRRELERVQKKVSRWNSLGRFKKAFLSSDHAGELKTHQDAVQTALEEMQLLVGLKTADLVVELKNTELQAERRRLLGRLGDGSYGARGNSIEDVICLPGTRVEILELINGWIKDTSASAERVLWIHGMAGRGKSTIASTVAHNWRSKGSCAIFHFRRGQNALDDQFVCALARQLGKSLVPEVKEAILDSVKENQDIAKERLDEQFKALLVGSLAKLRDHAHPVVIIVDALDECKNVTDPLSFIRLIDSHTPFFPPNVKFILTFRPEAPLLAAIAPKMWHEEDLDSASHVSDDITRFIQHACGQIRDDYGLPANWPSPSDIENIAKMSQGVFQWARTAIAYVRDGSPVHRLREILQRPSAWGGLDDLYHQILSRAFDKIKSDLMRQQLLSWVLGTLVAAPYPVSLEIIASLYADHEIFKGQDDLTQFLSKDILSGLSSLLYIPASPSEPLRLMHTSIRDLLTARERCEHRRYFVDLVQNHWRLAGLTLHIMGRDLRQNICNLNNLSKANSDIQDIVESHLSQGIRYCCRSWSIHLTAGAPRPETEGETAIDVVAEFKLVSDEKLLFWLEVMSLIGVTSEAFTASNRVYQWLLQRPSETFYDSLVKLWNDIQRFIAAFFEPISFGALHIYASALPHCPVGTKLWEQYGNQVTTRILLLLGKRQLNWPANIWTSSAGSNIVQVVFSPDGKVLAAGLGDGKVRLWDAQTGAFVGKPLTGHKGRHARVAFSPDGKRLASMSSDKTIRLWDAQTGVPMGGPLTGHASGLTSVTFSPDGKVLACGSDDYTVRLWHGETGTPLGNALIGHTKSILSISFSPDGKRLASGSHDETIRLWDVQTGALVGAPLTGHSNSIISVVFSPDGKTLASGSSDETVRLWGATTGAQIGDPLADHSDRIRAVAFSPDGKTLASGSADKTVRLWSVQTGAPAREPLAGHSDEITSILFSPKGKILASMSIDKTIRLWDVQTGAPLGEPLTGHTDRIASIAFSPDGTVLASGSDDETVRLWDARTGVISDDIPTDQSSWIMSVAFSLDSKVLASGLSDGMVQLWDAGTGTPLSDAQTGHNGSITSVSFSPNGELLASGSDDGTVRLWDTKTRAPVGEPLNGHSRLISSIAFSPDGMRLASGSFDKTVRLWDAQTGAPIGDPLTGHSGWIMSLVFSTDGKFLAAGLNDETVQVWDAQTWKPIGDAVTGYSSWITSVTISLDGKVTLGYPGGITWDPLTCRRISRSHPEPITSGQLKLRGNWATFNSKRLLWFPTHYQSTGYLPDIILSHGRIVYRSLEILSVLTFPFFEI